MEQANVVIIESSLITPTSLREISLKWTKDLLDKEIYEDLMILNNDYPDILSWYEDKIINKILENTNEREVFLAFYGSDLAGIMILKKDSLEKKICTIRIREQFRGKKIGTEFFNRAISWLGEKYPLITVSETNKESFDGIMKKFGFEIVDIKEDLYMKGKKEYIYNGRVK
ncbi:GNAT family N-acetyltransferase [Cetobacterium sp.]|uniref:GNAT family N-acetyltransferase n=1 Tax=Cetobacterium sp. TaxID=2071632 RepID=UPI003F40A2D0